MAAQNPSDIPKTGPGSEPHRWKPDGPSVLGKKYWQIKSESYKPECSTPGCENKMTPYAEICAACRKIKEGTPDKEKVAELWKAGKTQPEIAAALGCKKHQVNGAMRALRRKGMILPKRNQLRPDGGRKEKMRTLAEWLMSNQCVDCGERDWLTLECDHVGKKTAALSLMLDRSDWTVSDMVAELKQCECVCVNCHKIRTRTREKSLAVVEGLESLSLAEALAMSASWLVPDEIISPWKGRARERDGVEEMRKRRERIVTEDEAECLKCNRTLSLEEFYKRRSGYPNAYCKDCGRKRARETRRHPDQRKHQAALKERNLRYKAAVLLRNPCVDCGEAEIKCLEFDHVRGKKARAVGTMMLWTDLEKIKAEIEKCEVRCACCHRLKTMRDQGSWRLSWADASESVDEATAVGAEA